MTIQTIPAETISKKPQSAEKRYAEICATIRTTDEVSFKLLGLVPLLSGAAIVSLSKGGPPGSPLLVFVSLFGAVVSFGLYRWELRNIQTCGWLRDQGAAIEAEEFGLGKGQFAGRTRNEFPPPRFLGFPIGKTEAERIIYTATIIAWLILPWVNALPRL
jgi:hypothetical protein